MGYYTRQDLPIYYAPRQAPFTICDNYCCSGLGPTHPNRLMAMSGTIDPSGKAGGPVIITNEDTDAIWSAHWDDHARGPRRRRHQLEGSTTPKALSTRRRSSRSTGS